MGLELARDVPASDPHLAEALAEIEEGWFGAYEGHVGFWAQITFEIAVDEVRADHRVEAGEVVRLRDAVRDLRLPELSPERKDELRLVKASVDGKVRQELGLPAASGAPPAGIEGALGAAGWAVSRCEEGPEGGMCLGRRDHLAVRVDTAPVGALTGPGVVRSRTADAVRVTVLDARAGAAAREALLPASGRLADLSGDAVRSGLVEAGWSLTACDDRVCEGAHELRWIRVVLRPSPSDAPGRRTVEDDGSVTYTQGDGVLAVSVGDDRAAGELAAALAP